MQPIDEAQRRRTLTWSAVLCAIPLCLAPLAGRSSFELASEQTAFNARFTAPALDSVWNDKPVTVARDPFMPEVSAQAPSDSLAGVAGMHVVQGQPTGFVLPPSRGANGMPLQGVALGAPTVTAVISGPSARALVEDGGQVRMVGIGEAIAGSRVVSIDGQGIHLQNKTLLRLAGDQP